MSLAKSSTPLEQAPTVIHILRHGEGLHNTIKKYPFPDPPLTDLGKSQAQAVKIEPTPDLILISPMARTIHTALLAFQSLSEDSTTRTQVQIWPDLREAHDAICNKGVSKAEITAQFPQFDFSECHEEWDYPPTTAEGAAARAEQVRRRLKDLTSSYRNICLVSHRAFISCLVDDERFEEADCRQYRFATGVELERDHHGVNSSSGLHHNFGPTLLVRLDGDQAGDH